MFRPRFRFRHRCPPTRRPRQGQAVVLLLAVLLVFVAMAFWILDIYKPLLAKLRVQDGGDAAVLAAARWQAAGLNLIGELNLIQAYMLADDLDNLEAAKNLHVLSQRIAVTSPFLGLWSAHMTAERNRLDPLPGASGILRTRSEGLKFDLYPDAEEDVRAIVDFITREDLRVFPLSSLGDEADPPSMLTNRNFHLAILARDWCWFWFYAYDFLKEYVDRSQFGPAPKFRAVLPFDLRIGSSEIATLNMQLAAGVPFNERLTELSHPMLPLPLPPETSSPSHTERETPVRWSVYREDDWGPWKDMHRDALPLRGILKEKYDYDGADVSLAVRRGKASWLAAAKPFGSIAEQRPNTFSLVLGGFGDVRLIPLDAADSDLSGFDPVWLEHVHSHLEGYVASGIGHNDCRYCLALMTWDNPAFRMTGRLWLSEFGYTCRRTIVGGNEGDGDGGGTSYAH